MKRERLDWLADNPRYTRRFAIRVGCYCRLATVKDVAEDFHLDWQTVKDLDKQYMREQLLRIGQPGPEVIGIDELSIGPRHTYPHRRPLGPDASRKGQVLGAARNREPPLLPTQTSSR